MNRDLFLDHVELELLNAIKARLELAFTTAISPDDYTNRAMQVLFSNQGRNLSERDYQEAERYDAELHDRLCQIRQKIPRAYRGVHSIEEWQQVLEEH